MKGGVGMPMSPTIVCNNILSRGFAEKRDISPMKLQKLMYFVACEYQKDAHTVLFSEPFEVWRYDLSFALFMMNLRHMGKTQSLLTLKMPKELLISWMNLHHRN